MMKIKTEKSWLFWFVFFSLLSAALIFQSSFLPSGGGAYNFIPYFTLPAIVFFFLHNEGFSSLGLLLFISFLSSAFSPLAVPSFFYIYFSFFFLILFIKKFFFFKSSFLFFILVFIFSLFFSYLVDLVYYFSKRGFSFPTHLSYFLKATTTLILSFLLFPIFKKYLQEGTRF